MDLKRISEWLTAAEGLGRALTAFVAACAAIWAALTTRLDPVLKTFGLPTEVLYVIAGAALLAFLILGWRVIRRFKKASRLEKPGAFVLHPTDPESLIGREKDLEKLLGTVKRNRLVLLDGESGCGKSTLVRAGLVPELQQTSGLLPIVIDDWGSDWERGALSAALDALSESVSDADRERLQWTSLPDPAAKTHKLVDDLRARLKDIGDHLGRRPLVIADQFDDYQARQLEHFLDEEGNWLAPGRLAESNEFWKRIDIELRADRLHLLVVTRADTAGGLACVRFLDDAAAHPLFRVESQYLHPLLAGLAPDDSSPPVVSNPKNGWHQLRERLETDLKDERAILMQQVHTVLKGLAKLPLLTVKAYRRAGGLRGVQTLFISRALERAGGAAGSKKKGVHVARAVVAAMVLADDPNQPPKAKRTSFSHLGDLVGDPEKAEKILYSLQEDEVVRPAAVTSDGAAWQLYHDYLVDPIMSEARHANRWLVALQEGKRRYDLATSKWRKWRALLPIRHLLVICWARARGRLRFDQATGYVRLSAARAALLVLVLAVIGGGGYGWNQNRLLTVQARQLVAQFGDPETGRRAVLAVWRAPESLRRHVYQLVIADPATLVRAVDSGWPLADVGLDPIAVNKMASMLRGALEQKLSRGVFTRGLVRAYAAFAPRLDAAAARVEAQALRTQMTKTTTSSDTVTALVRAYAVFAPRLDAEAAKVEAQALRTQMTKTTTSSDTVTALARAYAVFAPRLDAEVAQVEAETLRTQMTKKATSSDTADALALAYAALAPRLDATAAKEVADTLCAQMVKAMDGDTIRALAQAYGALATRLNPAAAKGGAEAMRAQMGKTTGYTIRALARAYATLVPRLDAEVAQVEAQALRTQMTKTTTSSDTANALARAYAALAPRLDAEVAQVEAQALRPQMIQAVRAKTYMNPDSGKPLVRAYAALAPRLDAAAAQVEAQALRMRMMKSTTSSYTADVLSRAYVTLAPRLDAAAAQVEAQALRPRMVQAVRAKTIMNPGTANDLVRAYVAIAPRLDAEAAKVEAEALRTQITKKTTSSDTASALAWVYARIAPHLGAEVVQVEIQALRTQMFQALHAQMTKKTTSPDTALALARAYAAFAPHLNAAVAKEVAETLRTQMPNAQNQHTNIAQAQAYMALAPLLDVVAAKKVAETIRMRVERDPSLVFSVIGEAYRALVPRLDAVAAQVEAQAWRTQITKKTTSSDTANVLAQVYAIFAPRLDAAIAKVEAETLRTQITKKTTSSDTANALARAYAALAPRLDAAAAQGEAEFVRAQMVKATDSDTVTTLAQAYAAMAKELLNRNKNISRSTLVRDTLTLAGQPFLSDPSPLLAVLKPVANRDFGGDIAQAVSWAGKTYGIRPQELRPAPLN